MKEKLAVLWTLVLSVLSESVTHNARENEQQQKPYAEHYSIAP